IPSFIDMPFPLVSLITTFAPALWATAAVLSSDLSSTTITSETMGSARQKLITCSIVFSSFNAGITTLNMLSFLGTQMILCIQTAQAGKCNESFSIRADITFKDQHYWAV